MFSSDLNADVLVLKDGKRIKADKVTMKNGNLVEIRIGKETQIIEFSKVESILPEFPAKREVKEVRKEKISKSQDQPTDKTQQNGPLSTESLPSKTQEPIENNATSTVAEPKKKNRYYGLQALIPGWSPLLLSDDYKVKATGGIIAFSELYLLYRGLEFFAKPERYFQAPFSPSSEATIPWILSFNSGLNASTNNLPVLIFNIQAPHYVVTQRGHVMEDSEFNRQRNFYGFALLAVLTLDIVLSKSSLMEGNIRSVRLITSDGGNTSSIAVTWIF
ncbi:hypothetical protein [Leptospira yasudae]|uniref:Uncharacterized protein n=1 Tax=Leptospira yasudae TaxID=2202201 RepID=A0A6N4QXD3_9LEPT|nr:hypothetical protein [Leptospira yasudae]TGL82095.1 hypothetical protein EHQ72_04670 [Leptospira yasudae]TGL83192.1 hypothetical protein EHQ77_02780 [Leptospira yasudae]TGL87452.1 hypothetical protein EHQ83_04530 [Leptospira yasudae]